MRLIGFVLALVLAVPALAEPVDEKTAQKELFSERGRIVTISDVGFLGKTEKDALDKFAKSLAYYAAMAVSEGDPVANGSGVALANFHSPAAAEKAALAACNARRTVGKPCIIIARTYPRNFKVRDLSLSVEATTAFKKEYRRASAPKAMAISDSTGQFGIERGDGGRAIAACNAKASKAPGGSADCRVVIQDR